LQRFLGDGFVDGRGIGGWKKTGRKQTPVVIHFALVFVHEHSSFYRARCGGRHLRAVKVDLIPDPRKTKKRRHPISKAPASISQS